MINTPFPGSGVSALVSPSGSHLSIDPPRGDRLIFRKVISYLLSSMASSQVGTEEYALLGGACRFHSLFPLVTFGGLGVTLGVKTITCFFRPHLWIFWQ